MKMGAQRPKTRPSSRASILTEIPAVNLLSGEIGFWRVFRQGRCGLDEKFCCTTQPGELNTRLLLKRVLRSSGLLATKPRAGRPRPDLTRFPVNFWVVPHYPNYLIVYDPEAKPLQIIRILHAARDLPTILT